MDSTRQSKISRLLQKEIANYFLLHSQNYLGAMISVSEVRVTSDLDEAKIFVSIFPNEKRQEIFNKIETDTKEIRFETAKKIRFQLRRIPEFSNFWTKTNNKRRFYAIRSRKTFIRQCL